MRLVQLQCGQSLVRKILTSLTLCNDFCQIYVSVLYLMDLIMPTPVRRLIESIFYVNIESHQSPPLLSLVFSFLPLLLLVDLCTRI